LTPAGLVTQIADANRIDAATRDLALSVAAHAPLTIAATKEMIRRVQEDRRPAPERGDDLVGRCYGSADFREGVGAFLSKRSPRWTGV
jgi:enoyl-CoA hydratase/carnithine racemase